MRPTIEFLNARRALLPASGGTNYKLRETAKYAPDCELDPIERTELEHDSAWRMYHIRAEAMWQQIFERFGFLPAETVDEIPF